MTCDSNRVVPAEDGLVGILEHGQDCRTTVLSRFAKPKQSQFITRRVMAKNTGIVGQEHSDHARNYRPSLVAYLTTFCSLNSV